MDLRVTEVQIPRDEHGKPKSNRKYTEYYNGRGHSLPLKETPQGKTRVFVSVRGEGIWEDMENRTSRPHTLWAPLVKQALLDNGWPADIKLRWSQKAGCSCPCSPAFFVTGGPSGLDIWATIESDVKQADPDVAADRHAQLAADPTIAPFLGV